jgi:hypothetical protein
MTRKQAALNHMRRSSWRAAREHVLQRDDPLSISRLSRTEGRCLHLRKPHFTRQTLMPALLNMGTVLIEEAIVVVSSRQHLKGAYNRARESTQRAVSGVEFWSPRGVQTARIRLCGVRWRPNRLLVSLLFFVRMPASD